VSGDSEHDVSEDRPGLPPTVGHRVLLSWASLAAERLWPVLWPAGGVVGLFIILALANVFAYLPEWLHLISLMGFVAALVAAVMWSLQQTAVPTRAQAVRFLEQSSGLDHRPLSALEDKPATGSDEDTSRLWHAHRRWVFDHIHRLKVAWPKLSLAARDPHALRVLIVLVIAALTVANWSDVPARLSAALSPGWAQGNVPATFEAWVTPPAYTGEPPRHLSAATQIQGDNVIAVPRGSTLTVRTHGDASAVLKVSSLGGSVPNQSRPEFLPAGGDARDAKLSIDTDMMVRLSLNASLSAQWRLKTLADTPPQIGFKTPLAVTQAQSMRFHYAIKDDYGVTSAQARIELVHEATPSSRKAPAPIVFELPLPPAPARSGDAAIFKDLTAHVWAGLKVRVILVARDELGQEARSKPVTIILPERRFNEPLARALVEQRRNLARDVSSAPMVARALDALSIAPQRFTPDRGVYLGLRTAFFMVSRSRGGAEVGSVQQLLWDLALRIEEGDTPQAQAELRAIQQKLMEALAKGAPDDEIERLLAQLRSAIDRAVKAMAERAKADGHFPQGPGGQTVRPQDLQSMMDQIQNLARQGSRAAAQQMLAQLQNMLENMQAQGGGKMTAEQKAATQALEKLGSLMARQRSLMDKTFREQQDVEEAPERQGKPSALKGDQSKLGDELTQIIKQAGQTDEAARALTRAQDSMDDATDQLGTGKLGQAGKSQQKALDELRRGGEAIAKQLLQQMAGQGATMPGEGPGMGENEDPFGRPQSSYGPAFGDSVKVPDKIDIQKAREILEELQRRAAERGRPVYELEYIERLLRRF
jgi:uncharacterized protein (TIGR02302 family)